MSNVYELPIARFAKRLELFEDSEDISEQLIRIYDEADGIMREGDRFWIIDAADSLVSLHKDCLVLLAECQKIRGE